MWPKLKEQTTFNLPPHGPVCFAAALDPDIDVKFIDEKARSNHEAGWGRILDKLSKVVSDLYGSHQHA